MGSMVNTIPVRRDTFEDLLKKKKEFDVVIESIELSTNPKVQKDLKSSRKDIKEGKVHNLRDILKK